MVFSNAVGNDGWVYSFDPVEDNLEVFEENLKIFPYKNIDIFPCGLSDKNKDGAPIRLNGYAPGFNIFSAEMNNIRLPLRTIDYLVDSGEIENTILNAGDIFNCRCYPEPLTDINDIKFPHKVYYGGTIRHMTKNQFLKIM